MRLIEFTNLPLVLLATVLFAGPVSAQTTKAAEFSRVTITMKTEGGPCDCIAPAYSVSVDESGTVLYTGLTGVSVRGERSHSISTAVVRDLVSDFLRSDFFSMQNSYTSKKLPDGNMEIILYGNATTISIDLDGKKKSVYIFYGAPQDLIDLRRKLFESLQIARYISGA